MKIRSLSVNNPQLCVVNLPYRNYEMLGTSDHSPCSDEFKNLMKCIFTKKNTSNCYALFLDLKACIKAHGLDV